MRLLVIGSIVALLLAGGFLLSARLGRTPTEQIAASPLSPRTYYPLTASSPDVRYRLPPGTHQVKLRLRSVLESGARPATLRVELLDADGRPVGDPAWLRIMSLPQPDGTEHVVTSAEVGKLSVSTTRLVHATIDERGGSLRVEVAEPEQPVLVRALTRREGEDPRRSRTGSWQRLGGRDATGKTPAVATVNESDEASVADAQLEALALETGDSAAKTTTVYALAPRDAGTPIEVPVVETVGGIVCIAARALPKSPTEKVPAGFAFELVRGQGPVVRGEVVDLVPADGRAYARGPDPTRASLATLPSAPSLSVFLPVSAPLLRYLPYPAGVTSIRLWASAAIPTPTLVGVSVWSGPGGGAGLSGVPSPDSTPRWTRLGAANDDLLRTAGRTHLLVDLTEPAVFPPPPADGIFRRLLPTRGAPEQLLEPRIGPPGDWDVTRLSASGARVCPRAGSRAPYLRVRTKDPRRLGTIIQVFAGTERLIRQPLLAMSASFPLTGLPPGCSDVRVKGLHDSDLLLLDATAVERGTTMARRSVWEVTPQAPIHLATHLVGPERLSLTVYPEPDAELSLRVVVDGGTPRRRPSVPARSWTVPVVTRRLEQGAPTPAALVNAPDIRLGPPQRLSLRLGDDLLPGDHVITISTDGRGRIWVRASLRDISSPDMPPPEEKRP